MVRSKSGSGVRQRARKKRRRRGSASSGRLAGYLFFYGLLAVGAGFAVVHGYRALHRHPAFNIQNVIVKGASPKTEAGLAGSIAPIYGRNIFRLDLATVKQNVMRHPWVKDAVIHGQLPSSLVISVEEREPAGLARYRDRVYLVDEAGEEIASFEEAIGPVDFPVIIGLEGKKNRESVVRLGLRALARIRANSLVFWDNIETLDLSNEDNLVVYLRNEEAPLYLGGAVIPQNLKNYLSIAERIQEEYSRLAYIELGFPNQIAIRPR